MTIKTVHEPAFECSDGKRFPSREEAERHERRLTIDKDLADFIAARGEAGKATDGRGATAVTNVIIEWEMFRMGRESQPEAAPDLGPDSEAGR